MSEMMEPEVYEDYESVISFNDGSSFNSQMGPFDEQEISVQSLSQAADVDSTDKTEFCVLDFETTGFSPRTGARVIEIGAAIVRDTTIIEEFTTLCCPQPGFTFPGNITEVTSITPKMLHDKSIPSNSDAMTRLAEFIGPRVVVAHNASFDWRFLSAEFAREGCLLPERPPVCTLILSKRLLPKQSSYRLAHLAELIDFTPPPGYDYHRAMTDVYATVKLWSHLQDLAQESREDLIKLGEIKPPKQKRDTKKVTKAASTAPSSAGSKDDVAAVQTASAGSEQRHPVLSVEEAKLKAVAYRNKHFPPKQNIPRLAELLQESVPRVEVNSTSSGSGVSYFYDSPPIIPAFPPGDVSVAKNVVHKVTQPWRDSYELFQFSDMSFEQVVHEHPRKLARSTVFNHILDAFRQGEIVDLMRLVAGTKGNYPVPTPEECISFKKALDARNIDPTVNGSWHLKPVFEEVKSDETPSLTYSKLKWYQLIMFHGINSKRS